MKGLLASYKEGSNQCCIYYIGGSISEGPTYNFSMASVENIEISPKMSQDIEKYRNTHFFSCLKTSEGTKTTNRHIST